MATLACKKRQTKLISIGKGMPNAILASPSPSHSLSLSISLALASLSVGVYSNIHVLTAIYEPK